MLLAFPAPLRISVFIKYLPPTFPLAATLVYERISIRASALERQSMLQMLVSLVAGSPCGDIVFSGNLFVKSTAVPVAGTSYTALHLPQLCVWGTAELQSLASLTRYQTG